MKVLTSSPARAEVWPTVDGDHLTVHALGYTWAEFTAGPLQAR